MKTIGQVKVGDTFSIVAKVKKSDRTPLIGAVADLKSQVRDINDVLISELSISENGDGLYTLTTIDTSNWTVGQLYFDIQYHNDMTNETTSTETMIIKVVKDVTR